VEEFLEGVGAFALPVKKGAVVSSGLVADNAEGEAGG